MPSDDELRRVAEDVRALARSLGRDIRTALDRARGDMYGPVPPPGTDGPAPRWSAREDLAAAGRAARDELRAAQMAVRDSARQHRRQRDEQRDEPRDAAFGPAAGYGPRWDNWGGWRARAGGTTELRPHRVRERCRDRGPGRRSAGDGVEGRDHAERGRRHAVAVAPIRHRHDGTTLAGLLAVVFGLAWLAAATHLASVSTEVVLAIALMVVGVSSVVTARTDWALSSRSWPVVAGAVVAVGLLASSTSSSLPVGFRHLEFGSRTVSPASWSALPPVIHAGFGRAAIDLSSLPSPLPAAQTLGIDNAAGPVEIILPSVPVQLNAHIAAGQLQVNGVSTAGAGRSAIELLNPAAGGPTLTLNVDAGFGSVDVRLPGANPKPIPGGAFPPTPDLTTPTVPPIAAPKAPAKVGQQP